MDIAFVGGVLAGLLSFGASLDYIYLIFRGKAQPEKSAEFIWLATTSIVFVAALSEEIGPAIWFILGDVASSVISVALALHFGYRWAWRRDIAGLLVAAFGIFIWQTTDQAILAIIAALFVDAVGVGLVAIKTMEAPKSEPMRPWILYLVASVFAVVSVYGTESAAEAIYPVYAISSTLVIFVAWHLGKSRILKPKTARIKHKK